MESGLSWQGGRKFFDALGDNEPTTVWVLASDSVDYFISALLQMKLKLSSMIHSLQPIGKKADLSMTFFSSFKTNPASLILRR